METDYTGAKSVAQIIEHTGLTKFIISRIASTRNSAPVYEFLTGNSNAKALDAFNKWASITENTNLYEMLLFNELVTNGEEADEEKKAHNRNKSKSLKFTFTLTKQVPYSQQQPAQNIDVAQAIENALLKHTQLTEEKESNRKIQALEAKIDSLISATDDDDDDDDDEQLSGLNNPNLVNLIGLLTKLTGQKTTPPPINGVKLSDEKIKNINSAIKKLYKYDDEIDSDLLKLAEIAENNNATFKMLLNSLRTM